LSDSGSGTRDRIFDFNGGAGDRIDLSRIDANASSDGDQAFVIVSTFSGVAGQALVAFANGRTTVSLDVNGDSQADFVLDIDGDATAAGNFIL
jgi:serralysin